jgi:hypothetical protein
VGFEFDYFQPSRNSDTMAGSFNNQGTIHCDSVQDGNEVEIVNDYEILEVDYGECLVSATNIVDPGDIEVGENGLIQMTGQNVDLSRGQFNVESDAYIYDYPNSLFQQNNLNLTSTGGAGVDTNSDWNPFIYLGQNYAESSFPDYLFLNPSLAYFQITGQGTSNVVYQSVFVENNSPNAPCSVYLDPPDSDGGIPPTDQFYPEFPGKAHVGWAGAYTDPATGISTTNYLYLTDDYLLGASTNVAITGGVPNNFYFLESGSPVLFNPVAAGYQNVFPDAHLTNNYAFMNGQLTATAVNTNQYNGVGGMPVLPSRIQLTGNNHLDLTHAIISGQNYLSVTATNQFDGSAGAQIASPYSDLNLGSTNGFMTVTNLLEAQIPLWSGIIQAWSTRWVVVDATGVTNDYRVLLVNSRLQPTLPPWVHDLTLHATNSLYVSDVLNVYGSLFFDARSLTLNTNLIGYGATSFDGELNALFPGNLGPANWPNLLYVTNNGALRAQNQIVFTNALIYGAVINNSLIAGQGATIQATNFQSGGVISNGVGNFTVQSLTTTLTNGGLYAGGNIALTANQLLISNVPLQCLSLSITPTNGQFGAGAPGANWLSDGGPGTNNGNIWSVGYPNATGGGLALRFNPANGDLLGTTITNICPGPNKTITDVWAGRDYGVSSAGYTNNAALGRLILDVEGDQSAINFGGAGTGNALYVDSLEIRGFFTNRVSAPAGQISYDLAPRLVINPNLTIYFAQAIWHGLSIAESIENASLEGGNGGNPRLPVYSTNAVVSTVRGVTGTNWVVSTNYVAVPGRLRWVPTYAGYYSSTNVVVAGGTNTVNIALATSTDLDSDGDGTYNAFENPAFFEPEDLNFTLAVTNLPSARTVLTWNTVPFATNYVYYTPSLATNQWELLTSFASTNVTGPAYPVTVMDTNVTRGLRFYRVAVSPWLLNPQ